MWHEIWVVALILKPVAECQTAPKIVLLQLTPHFYMGEGENEAPALLFFEKMT